MAKRKSSSSAELYVKFKDTKKAGSLLQSLADAVAEGKKKKQHQCGALGRLLAEGKIASLDPLFPTAGYRRGQGADYCIRHALRGKDIDSRVYVVSCQDSRQAEEAAKLLNKDVDIEYVHGESKRSPAAGIDPLRNRQWGLTAIQLYQAQELADFRTAEDITIAVIDTGVDQGHPDLEPLDIEVMNFSSGNAKDREGHGTHVIGTIAAVTNNDVGIAGVCHSRKLYSLKALDPFDQRGYFQALRKILELDVQVLNLSLTGDESPTEEQLIDRIVDSGTVIIGAMGNDGSSRKSFPAAYRDVIAVGATGATDEHWRKSNRGRHIDLVAPGVAILSTTPRYGARRAHHRLYDLEGWHGTSMAAAFVTGTVALCLARNSSLGLDEIRRALHDGADHVSGQTRFSHKLGWGRLNVRRTLELI